ncbi:MAG: TfoX/Sxy family DNA transformation protein [Patescibacteria group bacterium]
MNTKKNHSLTSLINIGPKIASLIEQTGVTTVEQFEHSDPYQIFAQMLKREPDLCRCVLASLVGARAGVKWPTFHKEAAAEFDRRYPKHHWNNKC